MIESQKVLMRVDYNVPIKNGMIMDLTRIESTLPTINYLLKNKCQIVLMSHLGRPKGKDTTLSLKSLIKPLEKLLNREIIFLKDIDKENIENIGPGKVGLLENLRFYKGELENDINFCKKLSRYGNIYVNDAFGVCHRAHASTSGIHAFFTNKIFKGFLLETELTQLKKLKNNVINPYTIIVGGSKIGSKIHLLKTFLDIADNIIIGGGMAFPFIKYLGGKIGNSICEDKELNIVESFLKESADSKTQIIFPKDCLITNNIDNKSNLKITDIYNIPDEFLGVDIGPKSLESFNEIISKSNLIMWNGPMGISEIKEFSNGTKRLAEHVKKRTQNGCYSLIGGGDTVSDITRFGHKKSFSYLSTGGGAMLDFFKNENLPGIAGLESLK
ncbi:MAG: phosphoglycerate kinase [Flavobacteriales bacterium]|nr:phosphoglycerate kinase [Flavobacteriales bacterium]